MNWKTATISGLLIFSLANCATGDFCAVYQPVGIINEETAAQLVAENRPQAVSIATNEKTYAACPRG